LISIAQVAVAFKKAALVVTQSIEKFCTLIGHIQDVVNSAVLVLLAIILVVNLSPIGIKSIYGFNVIGASV